MDRRFRSFDEIDKAVGLPVFGRVGALSRATGVSAVISNAESMEGEAFRSMRTVLLSKVKSGETKVIVTSSSLSGDGKSTIVANLAASFAQLKLSVLIIDADMRRPNAHKLLDVEQTDGLADVLGGNLEPMDAIRSTQIENLSVMSAGNIPTHPSELLESQRFDEVLELLREKFQLILIDVGPVLAVTDPCVISKKSDGMLLVVRPSKDTKDHVHDAVGRLRSINAPVIGCVINTFGSTDFEQPSGYYGDYEKAYRLARKQSTNGQAASNGIVAPRPTTEEQSPTEEGAARSEA
jgi:capsular exopolysaccharide synthesis family protein